MAKLQNALAKKIPVWRDEIKEINKVHGNLKIDTVTVGQAYGGMRGIKCMVCDTSEVPPDKGLLIRGIPIADLTGKTAEDTFYLLCTGDLPSAADRRALTEELAGRAKVPAYVWKVLEAMPRDSHPMTMLDTAILAMQRESEFAKAYDKGMAKVDYWKPTLEDSLNLMARIPTIAAGIYRMRFKKGPRIAPKKGLTMAENYARMLGIPDKSGEFADCMRLYQVLHSDHEGGNVSAHACHVVGSALSDPYYAVSAGLNGLAGPLHGLANQEVLDWTIKFQQKYCADKEPTKELITQALWDTLNAGQVIPGYGHAVLRKTDPRYMSQREFCLSTKGLKDDPLFKLVSMIFEVAPGVLTEHGKTKNPWPNVDAQSGVIQWYYGLKEWDFYTVLFGVGRALGCMANITWDRGLGYAIERPKSVTTEMLEKWAAEGGRKA